MGWLVFIVCVAFNPFWYTGATSLRWAVLALGLPLLLCFVKVHWTWAHTALAAFVGWCAWSAYQSPYVFDAIGTFGTLLAFAGAFLLGAEQHDSKKVVIGLSAGVAVNACVALAQYLGWQPWGEFAGPAGLFSNRNMLAEVAALALVGCVVYKFWYGVPVALLALFTSWSRTSLVAIGAALIVALWRKEKLLAASLVLLVVCSLPTLVLMRPLSVDERASIWHSTFKAVTPTGAGLGSFVQDYPALASNQTFTWRPDNAHNDYLETAYETGWVGLGLFTAFLLMLFKGAGLDRPLLTVLLVEAFFAFPMHLPASVFVFGAVAGLCAARRRADRLSWRHGGDPLYGIENPIGPSLSEARWRCVPVEPDLSQGGSVRGDGADQARRLGTAAVGNAVGRSLEGRPQLVGPAVDPYAVDDLEPCGFAPDRGRKG